MPLELEITEDLLKVAYPSCEGDIPSIAATLTKYLEQFDITTKNRICCFLGQTAVESGDLHEMEENLNYRAESLINMWPKRFNEETAERYAHHPQMIANKVYANRMGNGDEASGDGWERRGGGAIQLTGTDNHLEAADALGIDPNDISNLLRTDLGIGLAGSAYWWYKNGCNRFADELDHKGLTEHINGGLTGYDERVARTEQLLNYVASL